MRNVIISSAPVLIWTLALAEALTGALTLARSRSLLHALAAGLCFGLTVDAVIQGLGTVIGAGTLLQGLSQIRFILHGILVPLLLPISALAWGLRKKVSKTILWCATGVLILLGVLMGILVRTEPVEFAGVLRYTNSDASPAFALTMNRLLSIGGVIPLFVFGVLQIIRRKRVYVLLSGVFMFAFSALAPATGNMDLNFVITMIGEFLMVLFLYVELAARAKKG